MDSQKNETQTEQREPELTDGMIARIDEIHQAIHECACVIAEEELEWDMEIIGPAADALCGLLRNHGLRVRYPAIVTGKDGHQYVEEYYS